MNLEREFLDRDFIETPQGFMFCVVGPYHPDDRVIAYLKYVPSKSGLWKRSGQTFNRVMKAYTIPNLLETFKILEEKYPQYLFHSPHYNIRMTAVPLNCVKQHYKPEEKLAQLKNNEKLDILQQKAITLTETLSTESGVPIRNFGVTGSILLDMHNVNFSDIDLTVYGVKESWKLKEAMAEIYNANNEIRRFEGESLKTWCKSKVDKHPLELKDALKIYDKKWNIGIFNGTRFSIHPVKMREEINEKYGDKTFYPKGFVTIKAKVEDCSESIFLPAIYKISKAKILEGKAVDPLLEVVSYESLYDSLAENGDEIIARGKLELVKDNRNGEEYYRILIGSPEGKGREFIKPA